MSNLIDINIPVASSPEEPKAPRPPLINEHGVMRIDNSSLEHFTTCARSAEYYLLNNRQLNRSKSALNFGSAIHECLELLYSAPEGTSHADLINQAKQVIDQTPAPDDAVTSALRSARSIRSSRISPSTSSSHSLSPSHQKASRSSSCISRYPLALLSSFLSSTASNILT